MNPEITSPVPAQDEMGMDYIPVYAETDANMKEPAGTVRIDPVVVQNIGVRTAKVEQRSLSRQLHALGRVDFNEERLARLHPKTSGWIDKLYIDETGTEVQRDTILINIYSPDLVAAQREYLVALSNWETVRNSGASPMKRSAKTVLDSARERLQLFDVPEHQIRELEQSRKPKKQLHIHSPFAGTIMHIGAREGQYITPKDELYLIADLHRIWVYVEVYEDELPWLKVGDTAQMRVRAAPGRVFDGTVTFIYPILDGKSRTVRVRLEFNNPDQVLKPGMFANVVLFADPQPEAMVIPAEAIVRTGSREQVFVVRDTGKFQPREVTTGFSAGGLIQILAGVKPGEQVVVSGQFLIDSESKLREATAKMLEAMSSGGAAEHGAMSDMDMSDMSMGSVESTDMQHTDTNDMDMSDMTMESLSQESAQTGQDAHPHQNH
jgi:Cu(I)/Ag(I) efflux system membrane fusion protein